MTSPRRIAEAFSGHRFSEAYPALAPDVRWTAVGQGTLTGRDADGKISVVSSCDIYEFRDGSVSTITSYTVELDPADVP